MSFCSPTELSEASFSTDLEDRSAVVCGQKSESSGMLQRFRGYCTGVASLCYEKLPAVSSIIAYSGATTVPMSSPVLDNISGVDSGKKSESSGKLQNLIGCCKQFASSCYAQLPVLPNVDPYIEATAGYLSPFSKAVPQYKLSTENADDSSMLKSCKEQAAKVGSSCYSQWPAVLGPTFYLQQGTKVVVRTAGKEFKDTLVQPVIDDLKGIERKLEAKIDDTKKYVEEKFENGDKKFKENFLYATGAFVACGVSVLALKYAWHKVSDYLNMPVLEHSKIGPKFVGAAANSDFEVGFENMVFENDLKTRLRNLLVSTKALTDKKASDYAESTLFSNVLLQGPVGLGKRSFVQELAAFADMDFYEVKSSALVNFKDNQATQALENFFAEVSQGARSAVVYIDNASVLFSKYRVNNPSDICRMIRTFVEKTERRSTKFMLVLGVQEKPHSDTDMFSVIDEVVEFKRPTEHERLKLLKVYRDKLLLTAKDVTQAFAEEAAKVLSGAALKDVAHKLEDFSSADIRSLVKAIKTEALEVYNGILSQELVDQVVARKILKYQFPKENDTEKFMRLSKSVAYSSYSGMDDSL